MMSTFLNIIKKQKSWLLWIIEIVAVFIIIRLVDWSGLDQRLTNAVSQVELLGRRNAEREQGTDVSLLSRTLNMGLALLIASILGGMIGLRRPFTESNVNILQAHVFLSIAAAMMMIIVGSELARAFGLMGAASIVRYRYALQSPKEGSSLVVALGVGIACGTDLFLLAIIGTFLVLILDTGLKRMPMKSSKMLPSEDGRLEYRLKALVEDESSALVLIKEVFSHLKVYYTIESITRSTLIKIAGLHEIVLVCHLDKREQVEEITSNLVDHNFFQIKWKFIGFVDSSTKKA